MYAIVNVGDKQFRVEEGDKVVVPRRDAQEGTLVEIPEVLLLGGVDGAVKVGQPYVSTARVTAKIESHILGPKVVSFKFRRRKGSKRTIGHRQPLTQLLIEKISGWDGAAKK